MLLRFLLALFALLPVQLLGAAEALLEDIHYQEQQAHIDLSIRVGIPVHVTDYLWKDETTLALTLRAASVDAGSQWRFAELNFEEADRLLDSVAIEGKDSKGYELAIRFTEPVGVRILPQLNDRQIHIKLARRPDWKRMSRFGNADAAGPYAINLESRKAGVPSLEGIPRGFIESHTIYLTDFEQDGLIWHRMRLGFFPDQRTAQRTADIASRYFDGAWVEAVSEREVSFAEAFRINPLSVGVLPDAQSDGQDVDVQLTVALTTPSTINVDPAVESTTKPRTWPSPPATQSEPPTEIELLAEDAHKAFESEDWPAAINAYTRMVETDQEPYRQLGLEMLGVAREMNDQLAHAKRYYELYLAEYAGTEGADRVDQRLSALIALHQPRPADTREFTPARESAWELNAQLSQFYQRHSLKVDDRSTVPVNGLFNDFNLSAQQSGSNLDQEVRITMSYLLDFTDNERLQGREYQVSGAYWEGHSQHLRSTLRVGRQSRWDSGALGRFDGAAFTFRYDDNLALGVTGGYLIDSSFDSPGTDRPFLGVNGEYLSDSGNLILKPFFVQQYADGILDRQALGLQSQLFMQRTMLFSLIDYDLHHGALNNLTLTGNFTFGRSQLNASYEHRRNPYLTTRNALMGQRFEDLSELEEAILDLTLEGIASDRTAQSNTVRLGWNAKLLKHWTLSADIVAADFSATDSSAEVTGLAAHKTLYSSIQLRSAEIFGSGSYASMMVRVADSQTSATTSLFWDNRFTLAGKWYIYPRFRMDRRHFQRTGDEQWNFRPSLRLDYRMNRKIRLEMESGYQWSNREMGARDIDMSGVFIRAGYRANF